MNRKWLLILGTADLFILSALDKIAYRYYFYWRFGWFDIVMHLVGGLAIGFLSSWAYLDFRPREDGIKFDWNKLFLFNLSLALAVGIIWEIFELFFDRIVVLSLADSIKDLLVGVIGSLAAGLFIGYLRHGRNKEN